MIEQAVAEALAQYANDFQGFCEDLLGEHPWSRQIEIANALNSRHNVTVRSGHGVGKTQGLVYLVLWFLVTRPKVVICITAPTFRQLTNVVFRRVEQIVSKSKLKGLVNCKPTRIEFGDNYATLATARNPEGLQGLHADPELGSIFIIVEEASGVGADFFEALEGATSTGESYILMVGNPTRLQGKFFDSFHGERAEWYTMRIPATESPFIKPGWVEKRKRLYGEDSDVYRVRVLGEFPRASGDCLVSMSWMEDAICRTGRKHERLTGDNAGYVVGVDVARMGADNSVVLVRKGNYILGEYLTQFNGLRTTELAGYLRFLYQQLLLKSPKNPNTGNVIKPIICVDSIGIGAGVFDSLKESGANVREVNVSESAPDTSPPCHRQRDWLYWQIREFFNPENDYDPVILVPEAKLGDPNSIKDRMREKHDMIDQLISECSNLRYGFNSTGTLQVEAKDSYKKRNSNRSPDFADALAVSFQRENRVPKKKKEDLYSRNRHRHRSSQIGWIV